MRRNDERRPLPGAGTAGNDIARRVEAQIGETEFCKARRKVSRAFGLGEGRRRNRGQRFLFGQRRLGVAFDMRQRLAHACIGG